MKVYVVTGVELGWDCVVGVYTCAEVARKEHPNEDLYVIHEQILDRTYIDDYEEDEEVEESVQEEPDETEEKFEKFKEFIENGDKFSISREGYRNVDMLKLKELIESAGYKMVEKGLFRLFYEKQK